jgi:hypothetical protein
MYTRCPANRNYSSWSLRAWLLAGPGLPFEERLVPAGAGHRAFSPSGRLSRGTMHGLRRPRIARGQNL